MPFSRMPLFGEPFAICLDPAALAPTTQRSVARSQLIAASGQGFDDPRSQILGLIDAHADIADRTCRPGHLTGSAFVVDPSRRACLLMFHTKLRRWLQPGGHADGDTNLAGVALREATEETGIADLRVVAPAIDIDVHRVDPPAEDSHLHLDVRFVVVTPPGAEPIANHESTALAWVRAGELGDYDVDAGLVRMARAGFAVADRLG